MKKYSFYIPEIKNHMLKFLFLFIICTIIGCVKTPNNINISTTDGVCVQTSMYLNPEIAKQTYPQIVNNPTHAPYCMAISLQNNNSGTNSNNVQVTDTGITLNYTVGNNIYSANNGLYDPVAVGFSIPNKLQQIGNISFYDPQNCAANQGSHVTLLRKQGGTCTFYLQLQNYQLPIGTYPINLTYNYTNGNENFSINTNINQLSQLYSGANIGFFKYVNNSWESVDLPRNIVNLNNIISMANNLFGYLYIATPTNIYRYNGHEILDLGTIPNLIPTASQITGITTGQRGETYAATMLGIYQFNTESLSWIELNDGVFSNNHPAAINNIITNINRISPNESMILYATTRTNIYQCTINQSLPNSCVWRLLKETQQTSDPSLFNPNTIVLDDSGNIYIGNNSRVCLFTINNTVWQCSDPLPDGNNVNTLTWDTPNQRLYVGTTSSINTQPSSKVYQCTTNPDVNNNDLLKFNCSEFISTNNNNLTGNIKTMVIDSGSNLFATGGQLNSNDFVGTGPYYGAYISTSPLLQWNPISSSEVTNIPIFNSSIISSSLTSY